MQGDALWTALPIPALILDAQGQIEEVNAAAEAFLNTSAKGLVGQAAAAAIPAPDALWQALERLGSGTMFLHGLEIASTPCDLHLAPLPGRAGAVLLLLQPREAGGWLDQAGSARRAARSAIGMAEMLAHEIKNPLAGITGAAQLLSMELGREGRELTDLIVAESRRIVALLEQVEEFGDLRPPKRAAVNLHDLLERARRSARAGFGARVTFCEAYDPSLPETFADPDQLMQVLLNLFKNAAEAMGAAGGTITLRTYYDAGLRVRRADGSALALPLQLEIIDDGPGLPPEIAGQVFEPFVSGRENGTGLGLALVSKIVADHEGLIAVESRPGRTVFRLSLPRAPQIKER
ncbi:MAG: PAS domain-containing sensor histidine kinase [Rhodobacterales bacterium]|nr:MAG: PAS domain-containing sensor histidine kinase [Rhodobacterales bacterium]